MSITEVRASDWIAAETPGTPAKRCPRNGLWVRSLGLAVFSLETARRSNGLDYISQKCVHGAVLIVNKSHRDTCISSFVLVSGTKRRGRRKGGVLKLWLLLFLWACASTQSGLKPLQHPFRAINHQESLAAAQNLARGRIIVLVRGKEMTAQAETVLPRGQSPRNHGPRHDGDNKGGAWVQWEDLAFLYPEPGFAPPWTAA